jgi:hypothetical protein
MIHLYTDADAREAFFGGDLSFLAAYDLTAEERAGFVQLRTRGRRGLEFFASLLGKKRMDKVKPLMPISLLVWGEGPWEEVWSSYVLDRRAEPPLRLVLEAYRLSLAILEASTQRFATESLSRELLLYESCKLRVASTEYRMESPGRVSPSSQAGEAMDLVPMILRPYVLQTFSHDLSRVVPRLEATRQIPQALPNPSLLLFYRSWAGGGVGVAKVTRGVARLLENCRGGESQQSIFDRMIQPEHPDSGRARVAFERAMVTLERQGVLVFTKKGVSNDARSDD